MKNKKTLIIIGSVITVIIILIIVLLLMNKKTTYNIVFDTKGGTAVEKQTINKGEKIKKPKDPTRSGYNFIEWTLNGKAYDFSLEVTKDITLTALWNKVEKNVETYTIRFETEGGTTISNQIIEKGKFISKPIDPIKEGYTFKGWTLNEKLFDFTTIIENNIELKAKWEKIEENKNTTNNNNLNNNNSNNNSNNRPNTQPTNPTVKKYTVTFNSNGGSSVGSQTINEGNKISKPINPTRDGYTFVEWTLNGKTYDFNSVITGNITLVAKWIENAKSNYTVTFNSNGGTTVSSQTVIEGNKVSKPINPTRDGYNFDGWLLNGNIYDFNSLVNSNITLVAKWNLKTYTVKATPVDQYSPDRILTVYEDGVQINVTEIKYNGTTLCNSNNMVINMYELSGITAVTVILNNGKSVTANVQQ